MTDDTAGGADRRSYFRVDDQVRLALRKVPVEDLDRLLQRLDLDLAGNFTVMSSLAAISAQTTVALRRIESRDPELASYLRAIDHKIEVIGRAFIAQEPELVAQAAVPANLSAGGICVGVDDPLAEGDAVEIRMLLFPSFTGLLIYGTVVECRPAEQPDPFRHRARIEFTHIRERDRELLIRHLLRRQGDQLREDRGTGGGF